MRWLTIAAAVAALALGLAAAGCGGGDDEASDEPDTVITDTQSTDETTTDETTESTDDTETDVDTDAIPDFTSEDCQGLVAAYLAFSQALGAGAGSGDSSDLSEQVEAFDEFADKVPDEIQADVQTLAAAYQTYAEALADIDLEQGAVPSAEALQQIQQAAASLGPDVTAASERLSAWTQENCTS